MLWESADVRGKAAVHGCGLVAERNALKQTNISLNKQTSTTTVFKRELSQPSVLLLLQKQVFSARAGPGLPSEALQTL